MSTILVADDERLLRRALQRILERAGYQVLLAEDGEAALTLFQRNIEQIELVLLDINMPKRCGVETMRAIKALSPNTTVLLASGECQREVRQRCLDLTLDGLVSKPFSRKELVAEVQRFLSQGSDI